MAHRHRLYRHESLWHLPLRVAYVAEAWCYRYTTRWEVFHREAFHASVHLDLDDLREEWRLGSVLLRGWEP